MIRLHDVSMIYPNGAVGLENVSLKIDKGEFVFITGESGSGKSTLLKLLFKEIEPTSGKLVVNKRDVTKLKRKHIPYFRREIGIVFQDFRLLPNKTVYENVVFAMRVVEARTQDIKKRVPLVLDLVGLLDKANCYPNELSGGQQQRVALARAIVNNSAILIADEPTGNLDPNTSKEIMECLDSINKRGVTVVVVTHEREMIKTMKKRVIEINKGKIVSDEIEGDSRWHQGR